MNPLLKTLLVLSGSLLLGTAWAGTLAENRGFREWRIGEPVVAEVHGEPQDLDVLEAGRTGGRPIRRIGSRTDVEPIGGHDITVGYYWGWVAAGDDENDVCAEPAPTEHCDINVCTPVITSVSVTLASESSVTLASESSATFEELSEILTAAYGERATCDTIYARTSYEQTSDCEDGRMRLLDSFFLDMIWTDFWIDQNIVVRLSDASDRRNIVRISYAEIPIPEVEEACRQQEEARRQQRIREAAESL